MKLSESIESGEWRDRLAAEQADAHEAALEQHLNETGVPHPDAGQPFVNPDLPDFLRGVVGFCGHRVAESEWGAGFRVCERCDPAEYGA